MTRTRFLLLISTAVCLSSMLLAGCSTSLDTSAERLFPVKKGPATVEVLKEQQYKGTGKIKGVVTYDGDAPERKEIVINHADKSECLKGDISDPTWVVDKASGAVANV